MRTTQLVLATLLLPLCSACELNLSSERDTVAVLITGEVVTQSGRRIPEATVGVWVRNTACSICPDMWNGETSTDASGWFTIEGEVLASYAQTCDPYQPDLNLSDLQVGARTTVAGYAEGKAYGGLCSLPGGPEQPFVRVELGG